MGWRRSPTPWVARAGALLALLALGVPGAACPSCGGGADRADPRAGLERPLVEVHRSDAAGFAATLTFGLPRFTTVEAGGEIWVRVGVPGTTGRAARGGEPELPSHRFCLLLPYGAVPHVETADPVVSDRWNVNLYPHQALAGEFHDVYNQQGEPPPDAAFWHPPFAPDPAAYATDAWFPELLCVTIPCGTLRDLFLAYVDVAAGRYDPVTRSLELYESVDVEISYAGGSGDFTGPRAGNPFESGVHLGVAVAENGDLALPLPYVPLETNEIGAEYLVLTHPDYLAAAHRLVAHKRSLGMLAAVHVVNDGANGPGPDTAEAIDALVEDHWNTNLVRPSYLCLLGDAEHIPTFLLPRHYAPYDFASDTPYGQIGASSGTTDFFSEIAVGRLPAGSLGEAHVAVTKIIRYESTAPELPPLTPSITIASTFQCCSPNPLEGCEDARSALRTSEELLTSLVANGYEVERIYNITPDPDYDGDRTPRYWNDETPLPPPLRPEDDFRWGGDLYDVVDAFNRGRLCVLYLDHGADRGWTAFDFTPHWFYELANLDVRPVVLSACCTSGYFDGPTPCFAEELALHPNGGAVAVFAWTRMANSTCLNDAFRGFATAVWPETDPDFDMPPQTRLGSVLEWMRLRMLLASLGRLLQHDAMLVSWANARMLCLFGDPSLAVRRRHGTELPPGWESLRFDANAVEVQYPEDGVEITAIEPFAGAAAGEDRPIGRAVVRNGRAVLEYVMEPADPADVVFYARALDRVPVRLMDPAAALSR